MAVIAGFATGAARVAGRASAGAGARPAGVAPWAARSLLALAVVAGLAFGLLATGTAAASHAEAAAGADFTRLLRGMALIKMALCAAAVAGVGWRLGAAVLLPWLAAYVGLAFAMAAGPGLIWDMVHVRLGALLLHGGLFASLVLLWRDPVAAARLEAMVATRRAAIRDRA